MKTAAAGLGMNQEKCVDRARSGGVLKWFAGCAEPSALELSQESERKFVESELASEIDLGKKHRRERWRLVEEAGKLLPNEAVSHCCKDMIPTPAGHHVDVYKSRDSGHAFFLGVKPC